MNRRDFIKTVGAGTTVAMMAPELFSQTTKRPNILWISTEDISPMHGCYGDPIAVTPFIDQLASEGVRYTNAFTCAGVCAPSRYSIITGRYQTSDGTQHMRSGINKGQGYGNLDYYSKLPEGVRFFTSYLKAAGYYCTNNAKEDYQVFTPDDAWDDSSMQAHWRNRPDPDQPFFHVVNFWTTHESKVVGLGQTQRGPKPPMEAHELPIEHSGQLPDERRVDPAAIQVPPYYPDTPDVRRMMAQNYDNVSTMDMQAKAVIRQLEEDGLAEDTIVFYWSDHGGPLARGKRYVYDSGTLVPLIARIPEKYRVPGQAQPGSVDDQMVSFIDLAPTMLNLAGVQIPANMHGRAFLGRNLKDKREYVFSARDRMDERHDTIRSVRDERYEYVRNYQPNKPLYQYMNSAENGLIQKEIRRVDAEGGLPQAAVAMLAPTKPVEELYDLTADSYEISNLANSEAHRAVLERFRKTHDAWFFDTRDTGLLPEPIMIEEAGNGSANAILKGDAGLARLKKLRATVDAANKGQWSELKRALKSGDAAIRYWGAVGLGAGSTDAMDMLVTAMDDASVCVRIAAAQSVAKLGAPKRAKETLLSALKDESHWVRLMAALAIDETDAIAAMVLDDIRPYRKDESKYVSRVVNRTLNRVEGTSEQVR